MNPGAPPISAVAGGTGASMSSSFSRAGHDGREEPIRRSVAVPIPVTAWFHPDVAAPCGFRWHPNGSPRARALVERADRIVTWIRRTVSSGFEAGRRLIDCAQPGSALAGLRRSRVLGRFSHLARNRATSRSRRGFARPSHRPCGAGSRRSRRRGSEVCLVLEGSAAFQELLFDAPRSAASPAICARGCSDRRGLAGCGVAGLWGRGARCPEAAPPRDRHPGRLVGWLRGGQTRWRWLGRLRDRMLRLCGGCMSTRGWRLTAWSIGSPAPVRCSG
jgi:hypothetical protein